MFKQTREHFSKLNKVRREKGLLEAAFFDLEETSKHIDSKLASIKEAYNNGAEVSEIKNDTDYLRQKGEYFGRNPIKGALGDVESERLMRADKDINKIPGPTGVLEVISYGIGRFLNRDPQSNRSYYFQ